MDKVREEAKQIFITAYTNVYNGPKDAAKANKAGDDAVAKAGYYLDKGKNGKKIWKKKTNKITPNQKIEVNDRSDENKKLAKIKVKVKTGMA